MTAVQTQRRDTMDGFAVGVMLALTLAWGLNGVAIKISNSGFNPVFVAFLRSSIAIVAIYMWCLFRGIRVFVRDGTLAGGLAAGVLFGVEFVLIFFSLDYTSVARGSLMLNTMPFWVLLGAHFMLGEHMSARKVAGLVLAFVGVVVIFSDKLSIPGPQAWIGDILSLLAGALWAATTLVIKKSRLVTAVPEKVLLYQLCGSIVVTLALLPFSETFLREPTALAVGSILFQAVFVVAFTYLVWFWLVGLYPASGLSSFTFLTPGFSVLMGALVLHEPLSWRLGLSLLLIAAGLSLVNRPSKSRGVLNA